MTADYQRMEIAAFGRALVETGDLDPVYIALTGARVGRDQTRRWLLAYWACYHAGVSSWISERSGWDYWAAMEAMARNVDRAPVSGRWPRGRERRHYRGARAVASVRALAARYPTPEAAVYELEQLHQYGAIRDVVVNWPLFGDWIAFKVADMLERICRSPVDFSLADVFLFDSPTDAAVLWAGRPATDTPAAIQQVCAYLRGALRDLRAPPTGDRPLGLQEFETVLCKWKAHMNGRYPIGIDTGELRHALSPWTAVSPTAARMLTHCPTIATEGHTNQQAALWS